jgi:hypothetical protein
MTLQGIVEVFIAVFTLSPIITQNFLFFVSVKTHFTGTFIFVPSCLKFAAIKPPPIFTLFQITESHM